MKNDIGNESVTFKGRELGIIRGGLVLNVEECNRLATLPTINEAIRGEFRDHAETAKNLIKRIDQEGG